MQTQQVGGESRHARLAKQGRNHKSPARTPARVRARLDHPKLASTMNRIERATGLSFEEWVRRASARPYSLVVEPQPGESVLMKLTDFTGRTFAEWSIDREVYEHLIQLCARTGQTPFEYVVSAIEEKCAREQARKGGVTVAFFHAETGEFQFDVALDAATYGRLKRAARHLRCTVIEVIEHAIQFKLAQLEQATTGGAR
jgi:predicted transcriptional regulator